MKRKMNINNNKNNRLLKKIAFLYYTNRRKIINNPYYNFDLLRKILERLEKYVIVMIQSEPIMDSTHPCSKSIRKTIINITLIQKHNMKEKNRR